MSFSVPEEVHRTAMVYGAEAVRKLSNARVIVFGVGGVGSWCAESLVRSGLGAIDIVDSDIICRTNVNRQCEATSLNEGKVKVEEMKTRLLAINPSLKINAVHRAYDERSAADFDLAACDAVVDAIDSVSNKILLIESALKAGTPVFCSMGAGAKIDPSRIRMTTIEKTVNCPLARVVRRELKKRRLTLKIPCVFSDEIPVSPKLSSACGSGECSCVESRERLTQADGTEIPDWCARKKRINGAVVHITAIFGFMISSLVIKKITAES